MNGPEDTGKPNLERQLQSNNYLQRLGLGRGATDDEIKKAFRDLSMRLHPDRIPHPGTDADKKIVEQFKLITRAAEQNIQLLNEAYAGLRAGEFSAGGTGFGQRSGQRERGPRTPENPELRRRAEELKIEAADVENFEQGGQVADKIDRELKNSGRRDELFGYLTRKLNYLLQQRLKEYTDLESLAELAKEVNVFSDSPQGRLLFTSFLTDELDVAALNMGLELLLKANSRQEVDQAQATIAKYPFTFGAIAEAPVAEGKEDAMTKIKFLRKITSVRPRTVERLDKFIAEVNAFEGFVDQTRAPLYKKLIVDLIKRHKKIYYRGGVFTPPRISPEKTVTE